MDLQEQIESTRQVMILTAETLGYCHPLTVQVSQDLDKLLNKKQGMIV